jgi:hypothetical protein
VIESGLIVMPGPWITDAKPAPVFSGVTTKAAIEEFAAASNTAALQNPRKSSWCVYA